MKLATWNVNSLTVRLPHVLDWLASEQPDVLCLQETKQEDKKFPYEALKEQGYYAVHIGQKTYNGVAIISKHPIEQVSHGMIGFEDDQQRVITATIEGVRIVCVYIPNGQAVGSEKYHYKLNWLNALTGYLAQELQQYPQLALLGDYNIAPEDQDVHDPAAWQGSVLVSEPERQAFQTLLDLGLHDSFRLFDQPPKQYSWWDYRMMAFRRNFGLRIDHILVSDALKPLCSKSYIDKTPRKLERPSDHTPVVLILSEDGLL
jgi:exodeoxyribonuclease-3